MISIFVNKDKTKASEFQKELEKKLEKLELKHQILEFSAEKEAKLNRGLEKVRNNLLEQNFEWVAENVIPRSIESLFKSLTKSPKTQSNDHSDILEKLLITHFFFFCKRHLDKKDAEKETFASFDEFYKDILKEIYKDIEEYWKDYEEYSKYYAGKFPKDTSKDIEKTPDIEKSLKDKLFDESCHFIRTIITELPQSKELKLPIFKNVASIKQKWEEKSKEWIKCFEQRKKYWEELRNLRKKRKEEAKNLEENLEKELENLGKKRENLKKELENLEKEWEKRKKDLFEEWKKLFKKHEQEKNLESFKEILLETEKQLSTKIQNKELIKKIKRDKEQYFQNMRYLAIAASSSKMRHGTAEQIFKKIISYQKEFWKNIDKSWLFIVLGGDGTTLNALFLTHSDSFPNKEDDSSDKSKFFLVIPYTKDTRMENEGCLIGSISDGGTNICEKTTFRFLENYKEALKESKNEHQQALKKIFEEAKSSKKEAKSDEKSRGNEKSRWIFSEKHLGYLDFCRGNYPNKTNRKIEQKSPPKSNLSFLNEVLIKTTTQGKAGIFTIKIDGKELSELQADGVLISTPTGSTGYNSSIQSPIALSPSIQNETPVAIVNYIHPYAHFFRPIIIPATSEVSVSCSNEETIVICDGRISDSDTFSLEDIFYESYPASSTFFQKIKRKIEVKVRLKKNVRFIHHENFDYGKILQNKFFWRVSKRKEDTEKSEREFD